MGLQAVRALISKAFADSKFKRRLLDNPEEVFSEFGLNAEERAAVRRMQARLGLATDIGQLEMDEGKKVSWLAPEP